LSPAGDWLCTDFFHIVTGRVMSFKRKVVIILNGMAVAIFIATYASYRIALGSPALYGFGLSSLLLAAVAFWCAELSLQIRNHVAVSPAGALK
jgi:hypothetical protein